MPAMSSFLRATLSISVATVLSSVTGYGRWMAMAAVLGTGLVAEAYGAAGVDRVRSRYAWDRIATATLAVYDEVLGRTPAEELAVQV